MSSTKPLRRARLLALAGAVAAVSITVPSTTSAASGEHGNRAASEDRGVAQAVVSEPLAAPPKPLRELKRAADAGSAEIDRGFPSTKAAAAAVVDDLLASRHWQGKVPRRKMPLSVGKLYTLDDGAFGECSAFAVRDPKFPKKRSYVVTAGHCLVDPRTKNWTDFVEFYPKYYGKKGSPLGGWDGKRLLTYDKWYYKGNYRYDVGVVRLQRFKKKQIVDRVGGSRLAYGAKPGHKRVRFIGYPAAGKYDGKFPYQCVGRTHRDSKKHWMTVMPCATREGASGGPWFTRMLNRNTGVAYAALSRGSKSGKRIMTATTFKKSLRRIVFKQKWG
ncbi:trypsin-like serine peptidase [Solicola gregarius]|uniref:Serine protease n=1 Tax=Solicola gregarius TaxID=2908642 RepID=A0AA46YMT7_9ACTN|nr:trypsin-like peptidase domain-containing protein [Solicola gregarius]UYM06058.1 hypothetical protein L0C25_03010 [Solicola gregarius]